MARGIASWERDSRLFRTSSRRRQSPVCPSSWETVFFCARGKKQLLPAAFLTCNLSPWDPSSLCRSSWGLVRATAHRRQKAATGTSWWPPGFHSVTRCSPMARTDFCPTDRGPARRHTSGPTSENRAFTKSRVRSCSYSFQLSSRWSGCHKNGISQTPYERKKKRKATLRETLLLSRQTCCR